jgi:hypothetical protein
MTKNFHYNLSNLQWYENFNTNVDVSGAIGVTQKHNFWLEYVAQELPGGDNAVGR